MELELEDYENIKEKLETVEGGRIVDINSEGAELKILAADDTLSFDGGTIIECLISFPIGVTASIIGNYIYDFCKGGKKLLLDNKRTRINRESIIQRIDLSISERENVDTPEEKQHKVFISHSHNDLEYIAVIVSFLESIGLGGDRIICSSVPPYCIPLDKRVNDWLINEIQHCNLHMIFALSKNYYESTACLNEMGAAWAMKHYWTGILLPEFEFSDIRGCIDSTQISIKLDDKNKRNLEFRLGELKDKLITEFGLNAISSAEWERKRDEFINKIHEVTDKNSIH